MTPSIRRQQSFRKRNEGVRRYAPITHGLQFAMTTLPVLKKTKYDEQTVRVALEFGYRSN